MNGLKDKMQLNKNTVKKKVKNANNYRRKFAKNNTFIAKSFVI